MKKLWIYLKFLFGISDSPPSTPVNMFNLSSQRVLKDKMEYENYLLDTLYQNFDSFEGGKGLDVIEISSNSVHLIKNISEHINISDSAIQNVSNNIIPLTFVSAFKVMDMIVDWIIEENYSNGIITTKPWQFKEKKKTINSGDLTYPELFSQEPYIRDCFLDLFKKLTGYRNTIIHSHSFSILTDGFVVEDKGGKKLRLNRSELGNLVRVVVGVGNIFSGKFANKNYPTKLIKYSLDQIAHIHGNQKCDQGALDLMRVVYSSYWESNGYPLDLIFIRQQLEKNFPAREIDFGLTIKGYLNGECSVEWEFPSENLPADDVVELKPDDFKEFQK